MKEQIIEILESYGYLSMAKFEHAHKMAERIKADLRDKPKGLYYYWIHETKITVKKG